MSTMELASRRVAWPTWIGVVSFAIVLVTLVLQSLGARQLQASVREWKRRAQWPAAGVGFPPLTTHALNGDVRLVGAGPTKAQIIVVFTTSCPYCRASLPQWQALSAVTDTSSVMEMVWLSLSQRDSTVQYVREHGLPDQNVVVEPEKQLMLAARIRGVPLTLVVDSAGTIRQVFAGALTAIQADSVLLAARTPRAPGTTAPRPTPRPVAFRGGTSSYLP